MPAVPPSTTVPAAAAKQQNENYNDEKRSPSLKSELRDGLLTAIAKARGWVDDLLGDHVASFAEIAAREGKTERYIRLLAALVCVPKIRFG